MKIKVSEDFNVVKSNKIVLFDQPSVVFFSLKQGQEFFLPNIKKGDYVYQEEKIAIRKYDHFPLYSTVSGIVLSIDTDGIIIKNDFKNRVRNHSFKEYELGQYTKRKIYDTVFELGIQNVATKEVDPYQKLSLDHSYKYLIINALQQGPYFSLQSFQLKIERKQLLELLELFLDVYNYEEIIIVIPKHQKLLKEEWECSCLDEKIKLIDLEEYYALSDTKELVYQTKKITYKESPLEKGVVVFNVSTLLAIYRALKYRRPQVKTLVQITGDMWKKTCYMEVRIGSYFKEILPFLEFRRAKEVVLLKGSLMRGSNLDIEKEVIDFSSSIYSAWKERQKASLEPCIRCGKCIKACPMHLSPVLIMDAISRKKNLKRFHIEKCIECGICSYVCSSNILIHDQIIKAKEELL